MSSCGISCGATVLAFAISTNALADVATVIWQRLSGAHPSRVELIRRFSLDDLTRAGTVTARDDQALAAAD
jgi:hypothetical protein